MTVPLSSHPLKLQVERTVSPTGSRHATRHCRRLVLHSRMPARSAESNGAPVSCVRLALIGEGVLWRRNERCESERRDPLYLENRRDLLRLIKALVDVHREVNHVCLLKQLDLSLEDLLVAVELLLLQELEQREHEVPVQVPTHPVRQVVLRHLAIFLEAVPLCFGSPCSLAAASLPCTFRLLDSEPPRSSDPLDRSPCDLLLAGLALVWLDPQKQKRRRRLETLDDELFNTAPYHTPDNYSTAVRIPICGTVCQYGNTHGYAYGTFLLHCIGNVQRNNKIRKIPPHITECNGPW